MKNKHSHRAPGFKASIAGVILLLLAGALGAAIEPPNLKDESAKKTIWKAANALIDTYGATDWAEIASYLESYPEDPWNVDVMAIPLSLGNAFLHRYEAAGDASDFEKAVRFFEWIVDDYQLWGKRASTPQLVVDLVESVKRISRPCGYTPLPNVPRKRIAVLWKKTIWVLKLEADFRLAADRDEKPFFLCLAGFSKAKKNASSAALFATAANLFPDDQGAPGWDEEARLLAYNTIVRSSDLPDKRGRKTCTVGEDLTLWNEGPTPDPQDTATILFLLTKGALTYRMTVKAVPEEFTHNVRALSARYDSYVSVDPSLTAPSDSWGDAAIIPLPFDPILEKQASRPRVVPGFLRESTSAAPISAAADLWVAIEKSKAFLSSYLWHFPSTSECFDVRYKMSEDGEVQ